MTVETDGARERDDDALWNFGNEVRIEREHRGMSQGELASQIPCDRSFVTYVENAKRVPNRAFAEGCDRVFQTTGRFVRQWRWAIKWAFPSWFRPYVNLEEQASSIRIFHPQLVPGLLQTESYARALLKTSWTDKLETLVEARMERQRILQAENAPALWVILDAGVLTRTVGGSEVMMGQLKSLLDLAERPPHVVQITPYAPTYHGWSVPFSVLGFQEGTDVVHADGFPRGTLLAEPDDVEAAGRAYDLLKAVALPPDHSAELIESAMKDLG